MLDLIIVSIIQGITEFLPISSSGHIAIAGGLLDIEFSIFLLVWLHASSLLAVLVYYYKDIWPLTRDLGLVCIRRENEQGVFVLKLLGATTITGIIGVSVATMFVENVTTTIIGLMLIATAGMIYLAESLRARTCGNNFTWFHAIGVGLAQGLAVVPGLSRSGTTIAYLVGAGIERERAVKISFLLSIPTIAGALLFGLLGAESVTTLITAPYMFAFVVGFITSLVSIKLMNLWVFKIWKWFIPYCLVLGVILILI
jgi:undecaprenyl-diphosphatase